MLLSQLSIVRGGTGLLFLPLSVLMTQLTMNIDRINERILQALQRDGRISNTELADRVGLSPSACLRRVQELENSGIIKSYRAILNKSALGRNLLAYVTVGLSDHTVKAQEVFEKAMQQSEDVTECHNVTGGFEYLLRVEVADIEHYKRFHAGTLGKLPQVSAITTFVVLESTKDERG